MLFFIPNDRNVSGSLPSLWRDNLQHDLYWPLLETSWSWIDGNNSFPTNHSQAPPLPNPSRFLSLWVTIACNWHKWLHDIFTWEINSISAIKLLLAAPLVQYITMQKHFMLLAFVFCVAVCFVKVPSSHSTTENLSTWAEDRLLKAADDICWTLRNFCFGELMTFLNDKNWNWKKQNCVKNGTV